jgi:hypothetical protein
VKERQCYPCVACCEGWLTAVIKGVRIKPGKPCIYKVEQGCGIYKNRPVDPCVDFRCGWLKGEHDMPDHMKPSDCGAIVMFGRKWNGREVIHAVPTGEKIPPATLEWLMALSRKLMLPLLFSEHEFEGGRFVRRKHIGYGPPSFVNAVKTEPGIEDVFMA